MIGKLKRVAITKIGEKFVVFSEKPSDRYGFINEEKKYEAQPGRINAFELFSRFTADIIKEQVVFTR